LFSIRSLKLVEIARNILSSGALAVTELSTAPSAGIGYLRVPPAGAPGVSVVRRIAAISGAEQDSPGSSLLEELSAQCRVVDDPLEIEPDHIVA
jgi:hypothetical protein